MPDANRPKSVAPRPPAAPPADPRAALAQQYLQSARAKLAEEEAAKPRAQRRASSAATGEFSLSFGSSTFRHLLFVACALAFDALILLAGLHMLALNLTVGINIAIPVGMISFAVWSYTSACYLGIIESTSNGHTCLDSLQSDWREWFWTLPASLGMFAISAAIGLGLSYVVPVSVWWLIAISAFLTYPVFQLSSLETGSPLVPISLPVLSSLGKHPIAWFVMYALSLVLLQLTWLIARLAWHDPPYSTMLIMGPVVAVVLFLYAWLLGWLAHLISIGDKG